MKRILVFLSFFLGFAVASATADMGSHDGAQKLSSEDLALALDQASAGVPTAHCGGGEFLACHALSVVDGLIAAPSDLRPIHLVASAGALASDPIFRREPKPPRL